jgi:hypothetical protein
MPKIFLAILVVIGFPVLGQTIASNPIIELEPGRAFEPKNVGTFSGAMRSCFNSYKNNDYLEAHQSTVKIMNQMSAIERNQAMGEFQYSIRTRTFNGKSLSAAECDRLFSSDWQSFLYKANE